MKRLLSLFCFWFIFSPGHSQIQIITLVFYGEDSITHLPQPLDSVYIQNITAGCDTIIFGAAPSIVLTVPLGISEYLFSEEEPFIVTPPVPNPFLKTTQVDIQLNQAGTLQLTEFDATAKVKSSFTGEFPAGLHKFKIESSTIGFSVLNISNGDLTKSVKLFNYGGTSAHDKITHLATDEHNLKSEYSLSGFSFRLGEQLMFKCFTSGYIDKIIFDSPIRDSSYTFELTLIPVTVVPTVLTDSVYNIKQTTASCLGTVISDGGDSVTVRGICWSRSPNPTIEDFFTVNGSGTGSFVDSLTGLKPDSRYYIRVFATNSIGTAYGEELTFATLEDTLGIPCSNFPTIFYEGRIYHTVQIGTQCWLRENLNVGTRVDINVAQTNNGIIEKYCIDEDENNCELYGGLYQWDEMMQYTTAVINHGICPEGWRLPYQYDWNILTDYLGGYTIAGGKLKSTGTLEESTGLWYAPNTGATNSSGFSAEPAGHRGNSYVASGHIAYFWNSEELSLINAKFIALFFNNSVVGGYYIYKSYGLSVRCLKDN